MPSSGPRNRNCSVASLKWKQTIERLQREEQTTGVLLTAEQQAEVDNFRIEMLDKRRELREVQRSLRQDVETLQRDVPSDQYLGRAGADCLAGDYPCCCASVGDALVTIAPCCTRGG